MWTKTQLIERGVEIIPLRDPSLCDEWVLKSEADKRIEQLEAEKQSLFTAAKHHLLENKKLQAEYVDRQTYLAVRNINSQLRERIAELERDLAILNGAWEGATKSWQDEVALRQARLDAVDALEVMTNGEAEVFASLHGFDPGFVRADHLRKALGGDDES